MTSAETEAAAPLISSSFPLPIRVAGSGRSRCCRNSPAICAPALVARDRNSSRDSSALNSGIRGAFAPGATLVVASRAACAPGVSDAFAPAPGRRVRYSSPTRNARSRGSGFGCDGLGDRPARPGTLESELRKWETPSLRCLTVQSSASSSRAPADVPRALQLALDRARHATVPSRPWRWHA